MYCGSGATTPLLEATSICLFWMLSAAGRIRLRNLVARFHFPPRRHISPANQRFIMPVDKEIFKEVMPVLALRIPKHKCQEMMKKFRG
jgi:hypothetical protein